MVVMNTTKVFLMTELLQLKGFSTKGINASKITTVGCGQFLLTTPPLLVKH
jgi:hypothetical protein